MRNLPNFRLLCVLLFPLSLGACADETDWAGAIFKACQERRPLPVLSPNYPQADVPAAYRVQKAYVKQRLAKDPIAGFKAGLTAAAIQQRFGVNGPVAGVLFASGRKADKAVIKRSEFLSLMVEVEIAFVIGERISQPLKDVADLQKRVRAVAPAIEFPDLAFENAKSLKGLDIIAGNVSAAQFLIGPEKAADATNLNDLSASLLMDGQEIVKGKGSDALGDQWKAALWLINTMVEQGWEVAPGHVLMTGALGRMVPGKEGAYAADFGALGSLKFEIQ